MRGAIVRYRVFLLIVVVMAGSAVALGARQSARQSPGSIALLANKLDAAAIKTLGSAITDGDPVARAVAARLVGVVGYAPLGDGLAQAFEQEKDATAAIEQARALLFLRGDQASAMIERRMNAFAGIVDAYADWMARVQPQALVTALPRWAAILGDRRGELVAPVVAAMRKSPTSTQALLRACLAMNDAASWSAILDRVPIEGTPGKNIVLREALKSTNAEIHEASVRSIAKSLASGRVLPPWLLETLTDSDRQVLAQVGANSAKPLPGVGPTRPPAFKPSDLSMRTFPRFWPGFVKDVLDVTGCKRNRKFDSVAIMASYDAAGRVKSLSLGSSSQPDGCNEAMVALARLTLADASYPLAADANEWLVLPLNDDYIACANAPEPPDLDPPVQLGAGSGVQPPRKIRDVKATYPEGLVMNRVQGLVSLEAVIDANGCVRDLRVTKGAEPRLYYAAFYAVSGWRFEPTKVDGREVPVIMSVTISFHVQ